MRENDFIRSPKPCNPMRMGADSEGDEGLNSFDFRRCCRLKRGVGFRGGHGGRAEGLEEDGEATTAEITSGESTRG